MNQKFIIEKYLKAWGAFIRLDRSVRGYTTPGFWLGGTSSNEIDEKQIERLCAAMQYLRDEKPNTYKTFYLQYVDQVDIKKIAKVMNVSGRHVYTFRHEGLIFLAGILLGGGLSDTPPGDLRRWGEYPMADVLTINLSEEGDDDDPKQ